ncbi:MAG: restriction endonuclease [Caldilineaceae bacterium]
MQYPLAEKIGEPQLLVGRAKEFAFFNKWLSRIPRRAAKSVAILARRKSGKTSFVQRIFNQLWSENGQVIPFFFDFGENKIWYPDLAVKYYQTFASHYISFLERDPAFIQVPLTLDQIKAYGISKSITPLVTDVGLLQEYYGTGRGYALMWETAYSAPHRFADFYDRRALVILDEFQNITQFVYPDPEFQTKPIESMAGSFHYHSESKLAPMLVTGSYVGWLLNIISQYLEAGRLSAYQLNPYLAPDEGLEAVYRYAEVYREAITNETALQINELCMADPFFISCVIQSYYAEKDLTTQEGVIETVNFEIANRKSEMSRTWAEYIEQTVQRVNNRNAKQLLLYLSKNADRYWTPRELKQLLALDLSEAEIQQRLVTLTESDLLARGSADIDFRGLQDGTLNLILRSRFEKEIAGYEPDLKEEFSAQIAALQQENRRLRGRLSHLSGKVTEHLLAAELRSKKRIRLSTYFEDVAEDAPLNLVDVRERFFFQRRDGKNGELDLHALTTDARVLLVEVKQQQKKMGVAEVEEFLHKITAYTESFPDRVVIAAFLSLGGFTEEARQFCRAQQIAVAERLTFLDEE